MESLLGGGDAWIEISGPANRLKPKAEATLKASMNLIVWLYFILKVASEPGVESTHGSLK
jgi:hypothetical protein